MKKKIGRIILSKILKMPLDQYLKYIDMKTLVECECHNVTALPHPSLGPGEHKSAGRNLPAKLERQAGANAAEPSIHKVVHLHRTSLWEKKLVYAKVMVQNSKLTFEISDLRLAKSIPVVNQKISGNGIVALKWINTRNELSKHILCSLMDYQSTFWRSGKETDLKPLTLKEFLKLYPSQFLDQSRLSRLLPTLLVETPHETWTRTRTQENSYAEFDSTERHKGGLWSSSSTSQGKVICLRELLPSRKKCYAYRIQEIINRHDALLKDSDVKKYLDSQGVHLLLRSICYYRKLLNIPNYKYRILHYYGKNIRFSDYIKLSRGQFNRIPAEPGVYELSITKKVGYVKNYSEVLYIGSSKKIRKRLLNYSGNKTKNSRMRVYVNGSGLFVRYLLTENYIQVEKDLLKHFKITYGELPKGNILGG